MNKLWTITVREYLVRVKSKSFIIATLLTPLAFGAFFIFSGAVSYYSQEKDKLVLVVDEGNQTREFLTSNGTFNFEYSTVSMEDSKVKFEEETYDILLTLPKQIEAKNRCQVSYKSKEKIGINTIDNLEESLEKAFEKARIEESEFDKEILANFNVKVDLENADFIESKGESSDSKLSVLIGTIFGFIMGFLMYMVIFIYGGMVMRSVMEEKINRIVEVIISSVKPFQLMLGKLLGVGAVGLTQLLVWIILMSIIVVVGSQFLGFDSAQMTDMSQMNTSIPQDQLNELSITTAVAEFKKLNWILILPVFIICFLSGYFIYSSLFAAIGAAIGDDMGESQSLMMPIVIPVIMAFTMLFPIINNPNGGLAIFGSMFPLFSPILLPARLAFDPPLWQVAISIILMIVTVLFMVWLAGKIYRVGILMYGKKTSFKEIAKWVFYKS